MIIRRALAHSYHRIITTTTTPRFSYRQMSTSHPILDSLVDSVKAIVISPEAQTTLSPADAATPIPASNAAPSLNNAKPKGEKKVKKASAGGDAAGGAAAGGAASGAPIPLEMNPKPAYFDSRIEIFDRLKKIQDLKIAGTFRAGLLVCISPGWITEEDIE